MTTITKNMICCIGIILVCGTDVISAKDWPEWCGQASRNMAAESNQRLPDSVDCGTQNDAGEVDIQSTKNVKWVARVGRRTTGSPVISLGRVFIEIGRAHV